MIRFATPIILASLLAMGGYQHTAAQEKLQAGPPCRENKPTADPVEAIQKRIMGKVERVREGVQKWAASGRDPSAT